jgi:inosine-uridine nucleoside N-ribohydrolase
VTGIHLDTDLGSDTDDLCALAMLLGWPGADLVGVTTCTDPGGRRAGWVRWALALAERDDVPVAAGAEGSLGGLFGELVFPDYWPEPIEPAPSRAGEALELLARNVTSGATVVAVGPWTNLAMLEAERPGMLAEADVVVMGGHVPPPNDGFPPWGPRDDWNVQQDAQAARIVLERCDPVVVPIGPCLSATLRSTHVAQLRGSGALGALVADQGEAHARDNARTELGRAYPRLPDDLLNFQYDPLACSVALGWPGVRIEELDVAIGIDEDGLLQMRLDPSRGRRMRVVTGVDGPAFDDAWLDAVVRVSRGNTAR